MLNVSKQFISVHPEELKFQCKFVICPFFIFEFYCWIGCVCFYYIAFYWLLFVNLLLDFIGKFFHGSDFFFSYMIRTSLGLRCMK